MAPPISPPQATLCERLSVGGVVALCPELVAAATLGSPVSESSVHWWIVGIGAAAGLSLWLVLRMRSTTSLMKSLSTASTESIVDIALSKPPLSVATAVTMLARHQTPDVFMTVGDVAAKAEQMPELDTHVELRLVHTAEAAPLPSNVRCLVVCPPPEEREPAVAETMAVVTRLPMDLRGYPHAVIHDEHVGDLFNIKWGEKATYTILIVAQGERRTLLATNMRQATYQDLRLLADRSGLQDARTIFAGQLTRVKPRRQRILVSSNVTNTVVHSRATADASARVINDFLDRAVAQWDERHPRPAPPQPPPRQFSSSPVRAKAPPATVDEELLQQTGGRKLHRLSTARLLELFARRRMTNYALVRLADGSLEWRIPDNGTIPTRQLILSHRGERWVGGGHLVVIPNDPRGMWLFHDGKTSDYFQMLERGLSGNPEWVDPEAGFITVEAELETLAARGILVRRKRAAAMPPPGAVVIDPSPIPSATVLPSSTVVSASVRRLAVARAEDFVPLRAANIAVAGTLSTILTVHELCAREGWLEVAEWFGGERPLSGASFAVVALHGVGAPRSFITRVARGDAQQPTQMQAGARDLVLSGDLTLVRPAVPTEVPTQTVEVQLANLESPLGIPNAIELWLENLRRLAGAMALRLVWPHKRNTEVYHVP